MAADPSFTDSTGSHPRLSRRRSFVRVRPAPQNGDMAENTDLGRPAPVKSPHVLLPVEAGDPTGGSWGWVVVAGLALAAGLSLCIDLLVAEYWLYSRTPRTLEKLLGAAEYFGHGMGVALILLTVFLAFPQLRWAVPRLAAVSLGSGLLTNLLKVSVIARARPYHLKELFGGSGSLEPGTTIWDSFANWIPALAALGWGAAENLRSSLQSFPSSHTATAVGLALGLSWLFPRGRWWFCCLAALVALQRVTTDHHYPSDVFAGAAVAWMMGIALLGSGWSGSPVARQFARLELTWRRRWR